MELAREITLYISMTSLYDNEQFKEKAEYTLTLLTDPEYDCSRAYSGSINTTSAKLLNFGLCDKEHECFLVILQLFGR